MDKAKLVEFIIPMAPLAIMIVSNLLLPKTMAPIIGIASFPLIILVIWFQDVAIRDRINKYPHLLMLVRPHKHQYHLYIKGGKTREVAPNIFSTTLDLQFPTEIEDYKQTVNQIKINHAGHWNTRVSFSPSKCLAQYFGQLVDHPQSEIIEVHQEPFQGRVSINQGEFVPTFILDLASKDRFVGNGKLVIETASSYPICQEGCKKIVEMNRELIEYKSQAAIFHEDSASSGEIIDQKNVETRSLLNAKTGGVDYAIELLLSLYRSCGTIDKTIKELKGKRFRFENWMLIPITVFAGFIYFSLKPKAADQFSHWISMPGNQLFLIAIVVALVATVYYVNRKLF